MNKTTLITGASAGIGFALAHIFAAHTHDLILVARRKEKLEEMKKELEEKYTIHVDIIAQDLRESDAAKIIYEKINAENKTVDILVNNAGFGNYGLFAETDRKEELDMIQVNITALTDLTKLFLPDMVKRKSGKILQVASIAAFQPGPLMAVYFATKAYVLSFSEALYRELLGTGVSVTCLCPGPTKTEFQDVAKFEKDHPFNNSKFPTAAEVAEYGYHALMNERTIAIHGWKNFFLIQLLRITPRRLVTKIVKKINS